MATAGENETVLVTGGSGFIGSNLVDYLRELKYKVIIFDLVQYKYKHQQEDDGITMVQGDITKPDDLARIPTAAPVKFCVHLAAAISVIESMTNPEKYELNNAEGSRRVLEWCVANGVERVVAASSAALYGNPLTLPLDEEQPVQGLSPYATTKHKMEVYQREFFEKHGLSSACLRFFNVYGPRQDPTSQYSGVISKFMERACTNQTLLIFGDGTNTRDFVFVKDIARAIVLYLQRGDGFNIMNVATGATTTIKQLADAVITATGSTSNIEFRDAREGEVTHSCADIGKITAALGYAAQVDLATGIKATQDWFRSTQ